jgi:hypothetical protein
VDIERERDKSTMSTFFWNGDTHPMPEGWTGLSLEDWFYRLEKVRDELMHADELDLPRMVDADGDDLDPEEVVLIQRHGFRSGGHWEAFRSWGVAAWAQHTGQSPTDVEFRMGGIARERIMAEKGAAMAGPGGGLSPVEGVSLEQWAHIQAALASGGDLVGMLAQAGIDRPRWDRVSAEWMARMQTDTTKAIATAYGNAFAGAGQGRFGAHAAQAAAVGVGGNVGAEPVPFETFVQVQEAMGAAANRGQDANAVLASFGMTGADWGNVGMYWNKRMQQEATKYYELFTAYSEKYRTVYSN